MEGNVLKWPRRPLPLCHSRAIDHNPVKDMILRHWVIEPVTYATSAKNCIRFLMLPTDQTRVSASQLQYNTKITYYAIHINSTDHVCKSNFQKSANILSNLQKTYFPIMLYLIMQIFA